MEAGTQRVAADAAAGERLESTLCQSEGACEHKCLTVTQLSRYFRDGRAPECRKLLEGGVPVITGLLVKQVDYRCLSISIGTT